MHNAAYLLCAVMDGGTGRSVSSSRDRWCCPLHKALSAAIAYAGPVPQEHTWVLPWLLHHFVCLGSRATVPLRTHSLNSMGLRHASALRGTSTVVVLLVAIVAVLLSLLYRVIAGWLTTVSTHAVMLAVVSGGSQYLATRVP